MTAEIRNRQTASERDQVSVTFDESIGVWVAQLQPEGPGGAHMMRPAGGILVAVDAVSKVTPVLLIATPSTGGTVSPVALHLIDLLFGKPASEAVADGLEGSVPYRPQTSLYRSALLDLVPFVATSEGGSPLRAVQASWFAGLLGLDELASSLARYAANYLSLLPAIEGNVLTASDSMTLTLVLNQCARYVDLNELGPIAALAEGALDWPPDDVSQLLPLESITDGLDDLVVREPLARSVLRGAVRNRASETSGRPRWGIEMLVPECEWLDDDRNVDAEGHVTSTSVTLMFSQYPKERVWLRVLHDGGAEASFNAEVLSPTRRVVNGKETWHWTTNLAIAESETDPQVTVTSEPWPPASRTLAADWGRRGRLAVSGALALAAGDRRRQQWDVAGKLFSRCARAWSELEPPDLFREALARSMSAHCFLQADPANPPLARIEQKRLSWIEDQVGHTPAWQDLSWLDIQDPAEVPPEGIVSVLAPLFERLLADNMRSNWFSGLDAAALRMKSCEDLIEMALIELDELSKVDAEAAKQCHLALDVAVVCLALGRTRLATRILEQYLVQVEYLEPEVRIRLRKLNRLISGPQPDETDLT